MTNRGGKKEKLTLELLIPIVIEARFGERKAMEELAQKLNNYIFRRVYLLTGGKDVSQDIAQNVHLKLYRGIRGLKNPERLFGWLEKIIRNELSDYYRIHNVRTEQLEENADIAQTSNPSSSDCSGEIIRQEQSALLARMMKKLSHREQEAFYLREYEGMSAEDIGRAMNIKPATARVLYRRAGEKIAKMVCGLKSGGKI